MKKHLLKGSILGLGLLLFSCSKENVNKDSRNLEIDGSIEAQVMVYDNTPFEQTNQVSAYADAKKQVLILAKEPEFRRTVFEQASLQKSGDYDLYIASLKETLKKQGNLKKAQKT